MVVEHPNLKVSTWGVFSCYWQGVSGETTQCVDYYPSTHKNAYAYIHAHAHTQRYIYIYIHSLSFIFISMYLFIFNALISIYKGFWRFWSRFEVQACIRLQELCSHSGSDAEIPCQHELDAYVCESWTHTHNRSQHLNKHNKYIYIYIWSTKFTLKVKLLLKGQNCKPFWGPSLARKDRSAMGILMIR